MAVSGLLTFEEVGRLRLAMLRVVRKARARVEGDVTPSQQAVLASVARHGPSTIGQIAEYEHVQQPSASRIVAALEQQGFVTRSEDVGDRRCVRIELTDAGRTYVRVRRAASTSWLAAQAERLTPEEAQRLRAAIPVLERLLADIE